MGLFSVFKRGGGTEADTVEDLQRARTRARQRLIGAVVLVGVGIVGFPLLFETHPRPIPIDTPIAIANKDKVPPLAMPPRASAPSGESASSPGSASSATASPKAAPEVITETRDDAGREIPPPTAASAPTHKLADKPAEKSSEKPAEKAPEKPNDHPAAVTVTKAAPAQGASSSSSATEAARARALLEGKNAPAAAPAAAPADNRFVVQVGAFAEADAARETRLKVEKLGLKTYTQVVDTAGGSRIRVRVGPFASKDDADRAANKIKSAGLPAALLIL